MMIFIFIHHWLLAVEPVAIITKLRGEVRYKLISEKKYGTNTNVNKSILSDSQIQTRKNAFSKIVYLDDGTGISIYPETEVIIKGDIDERIINKQINLVRGIVHLNITNQSKSEFKLVTLFSEVKCKNCSFWVISDKTLGDQFIWESGKTELFNPSVNSTIGLIPDSTITSRENIEFEIIKTPITDIKFLESLMLDVDEKKNQYKKEYPETESTGIVTKIVVIKLKNAANIEREIIVTYTQ